MPRRSAVWRADGDIDTLFTSLFRELLTYMMEDPRSIGFCTHLLFCAKNLERVGDHATNIAETAHYVITGEALIAERPKGDESIAIESLRPPQDLTQAKHGGEMPPRLMIVEDDEPLVQLLRYNFEAAGYAVETVMHGDEAETRLRESVPDLLILDWMLPGLSGIELCRRLRQKPATQALPLIMLTARSEEADRVRGFETGADDYVVKPFSVSELLARANSLLRRAEPTLLAEVITVGDIELDRGAMIVKRRGSVVHLGPTDYRLLEFLMRSPGRVFSREQLLNNVWGHDVYIDDRTVDVHIGRLRKALLAGLEHRSHPHGPRRRLQPGIGSGVRRCQTRRLRHSHICSVCCALVQDPTFSNVIPAPIARASGRSGPGRDPYVDGPLLARARAGCASDRLRSYVRSVVAVAHDRCQDGFRDARSKQCSGFGSHWVPRSVSRLGIDRSHQLLRLEQASGLRRRSDRSSCRRRGLEATLSLGGLLACAHPLFGCAAAEPSFVPTHATPRPPRAVAVKAAACGPGGLVLDGPSTAARWRRGCDPSARARSARAAVARSRS